SVGRERQSGSHRLQPAGQSGWGPGRGTAWERRDFGRRRRDAWAALRADTPAHATKEGRLESFHLGFTVQRWRAAGRAGQVSAQTFRRRLEPDANARSSARPAT